MNLDDRYYLHLFNSVAEFGPVRLGKLATYFPDFATAYTASSSELRAAGLELHVIEAWMRAKPQKNAAQAAAQLDQLHIGLLTATDPEYPVLLKDIPHRPPLLYYKGTVARPDELCVGIVGSRKISAYGHSVMADIVNPLVSARITTVSGLAYGVDAAAHNATLDQGGRTIAVLGGGLDDDCLYPRRHSGLAHAIVDSGGLLLSEYQPGQHTRRQHFVARNRIIAGLSTALVVVECAAKSGALITADHAHKQKRQLYAVPGAIHEPLSAGTNSLLSSGRARAAVSGRDILRGLQVKINIRRLPPAIIPLTEQEQLIFALISSRPTLMDEILAATTLPPHIATAALTFLELKGKIKNIGGQRYIRVRLH